LGQLVTDHPGGIGVTDHSVSPVDAHGNELGNPPIHIHHIHVNHGPSMRIRNPHFLRCNYHGSTNQQRCFNTSFVFEWHGDYQCPKKRGGLNCMYEKVPNGYLKQVYGPLDLEGDLNDVRANTTHVLEYYLQVQIRWEPLLGSGKKLASQKFIIGHGKVLVNSHLTYQSTFPSPTSHETIYWYTGSYTFNGELLRNKFHGHNTVFHSAHWFHDCAPDDLGMSEYAHWDSMPHAIENIKEVTEKVKKLAEASATCKLLCSSFGQIEQIGGFNYDRAPETHCQQTWVKRGQQFVVVSFQRHRGGPVGAHRPDYVPPNIPSHSNWVMIYHDEDTPHYSRYGYRFHGQDVNIYIDSDEHLSLSSPRLWFIVANSAYDGTWVGTGLRGGLILSAVGLAMITGIILFVIVCGKIQKYCLSSNGKHDSCYKGIVQKLTEEYAKTWVANHEKGGKHSYSSLTNTEKLE